MNIMAYNLSSFGSRFSLIFDPENKVVKHSSLGMFLEQTSKLVCGVTSELGDSFLPFSDRNNNFQSVYMSTTQNSVTYKGVNKDDGYDFEVTFTSPFAPQHEKLMVAPFFYVDVKLKKNTRPHNLIKVKKNIGKGQFVFGVQNETLDFEVQNKTLKLTYEIDTQSRFVLGDFARILKIDIEKNGQVLEKINCVEYICSEMAHIEKDNLFYADFNFDEKDEWEFSYVWSTYNDLHFTKMYDEVCGFLYEHYFVDYQAVIDYAFKEKKEILQISKFYDNIFENSSLSRSWKDFIAFTFQSYKLNTLYIGKNLSEKSFSVWEGNCMHNSTLDVEYNDGLFYFTMCKELLPSMLKQWAKTEKDSGFIDHDLGKCFTVGNNSQYSHAMEIEENCNFILMLHAFTKMTGNLDIVKEHYDVLKKLIDFMISADTTGNGIPNIGTSNTIDDAIPAIQFAKEQTYLALKSAVAYQVFSEIATYLSDEVYSKKAKKQSETIIQTVDTQLWKQDHYGVCLDECQDGYKAFVTKELLRGPMQGKDEMSIYAENGLLYPLISGFSIQNIDISRMQQDIYHAYLACDTIYGCNHSENSDSIWISQNLWRDFIAAYLDYDFLDNVDKYWEFQKIKNTNGKLNLYIDTVGENALWYYPRGLTSIGVFYASLRLKIDGIEKTIEISPLRKTMRIPLVAFTDWENLRTPLVLVCNGKVSIENADLISEYDVKIK